MSAPEYIARVRDAVPGALLDLPVWLLWKSIRRDRKGKPSKVPFCADGSPRKGDLDTPADRARLVTFDEAAEAYLAHHGYAGLGVALGDVPGEEIHLSGIDLDDVALDDGRVLAIMAAADSYAEVSPSGNGIKIFGTGAIGKADVHTERGGLEIYQGERFFTVTGQRLNGAHLADLTDAATVARRLWPTEKPQEKRTSSGDGIHEGGRHKAMMRVGGAMRRQGATVEAIEAALLADNARRCNPPLADDEIRSIATSAGRYTPAPDTSNSTTSSETSITPSVVFRPLHELLTAPTQVEWLLRGILERRVITLVAGKRSSFKSFVVLHWLLTLALRGVPVFLVSAEGAGLARRIEAWLKVHAPRMDPKSIPLYVHEQRVNFNDPMGLSAVRAAIEASGMAPEVLVIDTFSKNSGGLDENSNSEVKAFIGNLDAGLRTPLNLSIVLVAHTGHGDQTRVRGASAIEADTDAALIVNRVGVERVITVERNRFKDAPELPPLVYQADEIDLGRFDDVGQPVTSLVMREADEQTRQTVASKAPIGKAQQAILRALRNQTAESKGIRIWTLEDMRKIGRDLGQHKSTARHAVDGLVCNGFLTATVGGHRLADGAA